MPNVTRGVAEIRLSPTARADLASIDEYSAEQFGDDVADVYSRGFHEVFDLLRRHPLAGAKKRELGNAVRCFVHRQHRIFYRVDGDLILIIRIIHHAQNARRALRKVAR